MNERTRPRTDPASSVGDSVVVRLTLLAAFLALGHHIDHAIRGNHVGWPLTSEVNAFTFSLAIYPAIVVGLRLHRAGRVGPGFWVFLSGGGAVFLSIIHFTPIAIEPPGDIIGLYDPPILGWFAFGWLVALVAVLVVTCLLELRLWDSARRAGPERTVRPPAR